MQQFHPLPHHEPKALAVSWVPQKQSLKQGVGGRQLIWEVIPGSTGWGVGGETGKGGRANEECTHG